MRRLLRSSNQFCNCQHMLGGMAGSGIPGFIIGPTIAAMFIAVWRLSVAAPAGAV
jgi:hypothetical protein